jgi:hypothetical protein
VAELELVPVECCVELVILVLLIEAVTD